MKIKIHNKYESLTENKLLKLLSEYNNYHKPIEVDFRNLVEWIPYGERATHFIHSYPGKLLYHIPNFFLSNEVLCRYKGTVYDPFCGSGTVLLESILNNRNSVGVDVNPLAVMISRVKTTAINIDKVHSELIKLNNIISKLPESKEFNSVVNIDYWFYPHVKKKLQKIYNGIEEIENVDIKRFFLICLSSCIKHVSLANPRLSVPVRLKIEKYQIDNPIRFKIEKRLKRLKRINVFNVFNNIVKNNIDRLENFLEHYHFSSTAKVILDDSRYNDKPFNNFKEKMKYYGCIDLVITSPPYVSAQKYVRATSLSMGWLNLCNSNQLKCYENICIGREHFPVSDLTTEIKTGIEMADEILSKIRSRNPLRAHISASYLMEMTHALKNIYEIIKPKGYLVLIVARNRVCNLEFNTPDYLNDILSNIGFVKCLELVDHIKSRSLLTKRNGTSGIICREYISLYQKD